MPKPTRTATYQLIETKLDCPLAVYVSDRRDAGFSWRDIAHNIHTATGVSVTGEAIRRWFRDAA